MPRKTIETFNIDYIQILNENGETDYSLMPAISEDEIKRMYEMCLFARTFDKRALNLQREGRIGTYAPIRGQEASQIGSALALRKTDRIFPSFREMGVYLALGYPPYMLLQYWNGDERGMKTPDDLNIFPLSIPVSTHLPHAAGSAMASVIKGDDSVSVAYFGDGGTSEGDFHEGLNMAGVFRLPVIFICQNNQWAISVPRSMQTASKTLAQKAAAYGIEGVMADGNDIFAVYKVVSEAAQRARSGGGSTLIECFTYRLSDHTTADDSSRYRDKEEVDGWLKKDPILRLEIYMKNKGFLDESFKDEVHRRADQLVDEAETKAEAVGPPEAEDIFRYVFKEPSLRLKKQIGKL